MDCVRAAAGGRGGHARAGSKQRSTQTYRGGPLFQLPPIPLLLRLRLQPALQLLHYADAAAGPLLRSLCCRRLPAAAPLLPPTTPPAAAVQAWREGASIPRAAATPMPRYHGGV